MKNIYFIVIILFLVQCRVNKNEKKDDFALENTYWRLLRMNDMPVLTPYGGQEVHLILANEKGEKRIKGFAGCNGLGGNYSVSGNKIKFTVITTKIFCEDRMDVENFLTQALSDADNFKIKGDMLELYESDTFLVALLAQNPK